MGVVVVVVNHPAYSPDLAPGDYFLMRNLKYSLRGTWSIDDESLSRHSLRVNSKQKVLFSRHKQLSRKVEKMH